MSQPSPEHPCYDNHLGLARSASAVFTDVSAARSATAMAREAIAPIVAPIADRRGKDIAGCWRLAGSWAGVPTSGVCGGVRSVLNFLGRR